MRTFRLSDAGLAALAAGRPTPDTLDELRRAQISRHLLLLTEILRHPDGKIPSWYANRAADQADQANRADQADPMLALHTAATLTALRAGVALPPAPRAATRMLSATHDGLTLRARLEDTDPLRDHLGLATSRQLTDDEAARWQRLFTEAWRILVIRHRPAAETLAAVLSVIVPVLPDPGTAGLSATSANAYGAIAISAPADPGALAVGLVHEIQHSLLNATRTLFDLVHPGPATLYSPWRDDPRPAFGVLHGLYAYQAVTRFWRDETTKTAANRSAEAAALGRAEAAAPGLAETTRLGPAETARLGPAETAAALGPAETAGSNRPAETAAASGVGRLAEFEFARWRQAVVAAADDLLGGDLLTAVGRRFVGALRAEVGAWLDEPVEADVTRLAAGANAEHRARWQLRNLAVPRETVAAFVDAWRRGDRPPARAAAATVRSGDGRALGHSALLDLVHQTLRGPGNSRPSDPALREPENSRPADPALRGPENSRPADPALRGPENSRPGDRALLGAGNGPQGDQSVSPGGGVRPGDVAYLGGDAGAARRAYIQELETLGTQPGHRGVDLWAGLAIVAGVREPHLLRAIYQEIPDVGLDTLTRWLDS